MLTSALLLFRRLRLSHVGLHEYSFRISENCTSTGGHARYRSGLRERLGTEWVRGGQGAEIQTIGPRPSAEGVQECGPDKPDGLAERARGRANACPPSPKLFSCSAQ